MKSKGLKFALAGTILLVLGVPILWIWSANAPEMSWARDFLILFSPSLIAVGAIMWLKERKKREVEKDANKMLEMP